MFSYFLWYNTLKSNTLLLYGKLKWIKVEVGTMFSLQNAVSYHYQWKVDTSKIEVYSEK
jgi:hypothetical protein